MAYTQARQQFENPQVKSALVLAAFAVAAVGVVAFWWGGSRTPHWPIPTPTLPSPNGFDDAIAAASLLEQNHLLVDFKHLSLISPNSLDPSSRKRVLMSATTYQPAVNRLRQADSHDFWVPPSRRQLYLLPDLGQFVDLGYSLDMHCLACELNHNISGALVDGLELVRLGECMTRGTATQPASVGYDIVETGTSRLWEIMPCLNKAQARLLMQSLASSQALHEPYSHSLSEQMWTTEGAMLDLMNKPGWPRSLVQIYGNGSMQSFGLLTLTESRTTVLRHYDQMMKAAIRQASRPYGTSTTDIPNSNDEICMMLKPHDGFVRRYELLSESQVALLTCQAAITVYRDRTGHLPKTLDNAFVGTGLTTPVDPFQPDLEPGYIADGTKWTLYSIGPDGEDDRGAPMKNTFDQIVSHNYTPADQGDIVAAVNL